MKYVILIHANPDPWGHPTSRYTAEGRALAAEHHDEMDRQFEALLDGLDTRFGVRGGRCGRRRRARR